ncbi:N-6 DNA methylase, partial [Mesorhizobium sp. L2C067A000]|uniref:N-6 DNA methylase n=2 Tax=Mesorhizobium TaxID=68287 RepID=UPI0012DFBB36
PNGTLYESGVAQKLREDLLTDFNLHTVLRLPKGVFEPYTDIATNILFFDTGRSTNEVWFYEHPLPEHRAHLKGKKYSATDGLTWEEFKPTLEWWPNRVENDAAWKLTFEEIEKQDFDLAQVHPRHKSVSFADPAGIVDEVKILMERSNSIIRTIEAELLSLSRLSAPNVPLGDIISKRRETVRIADEEYYTRPTVQMHFRGAKIRDRVQGAVIGTKNQFTIYANDLILSRIDARNGAMAIVPTALDGGIATNDFPVFEIDTSRVDPQYLRFALFQPEMLRIYENLSRGSTNRRRIAVDEFLRLQIPLPEGLDEQEAVAKLLMRSELNIENLSEHLGGTIEEIRSLISASLFHVFAAKS